MRRRRRRRRRRSRRRLNDFVWSEEIDKSTVFLMLYGSIEFLAAPAVAKKFAVSKKKKICPFVLENSFRVKRILQSTSLLFSGI